MSCPISAIVSDTFFLKQWIRCSESDKIRHETKQHDRAGQDNTRLDKDNTRLDKDNTRLDKFNTRLDKDNTRLDKTRT